MKFQWQVQWHSSGTKWIFNKYSFILVLFSPRQSFLAVGQGAQVLPATERAALSFVMCKESGSRGAAQRSGFAYLKEHMRQGIPSLLFPSLEIFSHRLCLRLRVTAKPFGFYRDSWTGQYITAVSSQDYCRSIQMLQSGFLFYSVLFFFFSFASASFLSPHPSQMEKSVLNPPVLSIISCCIKNTPKLSNFKQQTFITSHSSEHQGSRSSLAGWFGPKVCHECAVK